MIVLSSVMESILSPHLALQNLRLTRKEIILFRFTNVQTVAFFTLGIPPPSLEA